jgi:hypothetical protein
MPTDLDSAKYVSFTSYKKDGSAKSLPVWIVPFEDGYAFTSHQHAYKVRRVQSDARVTLSVSNFKGVVAPDTPEYLGTAVVLKGPEAARVVQIVKKKYRLTYTLLTLNSFMKRIRGKATKDSETAIKIVLAV